MIEKDDKIVHKVTTHNHPVTHGQVEFERGENKLINVPVSETHLLPKCTTLTRDVVFLIRPNNKIKI